MTYEFPTVKLPRHYKFVDDRRYLAGPLGEELWSFIGSRTSFEHAIPLRDDVEINRITHARMVGYVVARLIAASTKIRENFDKEPLSGAMERRLSDEIDDMLERVTSLSEADRNKTSDMLVDILRRIKSESGEVTDGQCNAIKRVARANAHRCYLCATPLAFGPYRPQSEDADPPSEGALEDSARFEHARRSYELEHIFPTSKGGGRARENLAACCNDCNKLKGDLTTYAELAIESFIIASDDPQRIKEAFGRRQRFGILWRQQGHCRSCETPFFEAEDDRLFLMRDDEGDAYHFLNVRIVCGSCADASLIKGIQIRDA